VLAVADTAGAYDFLGAWLRMSIEADPAGFEHDRFDRRLI
jgi:hypothetical protein